MNLNNLRELVIRPALQYIELWSQAAENLVLGTALVESNAEYLHQVKGPALGLWQCEPATWLDIQENFLKYNASLRGWLEELQTSASITGGANELIGNLYYGAAICRIHYRRAREPLPAAKDAEGLAKYWKNHYNSRLGKGAVEKALPRFIVACDPLGHHESI
jgi:hypothetical protein